MLGRARRDPRILVHVPVIDFAACDSEKPESLSQIGGEVGTALPVVAWLAHRSFPEARNQTPGNHDVPGFVNLKSQEYRVCHQNFLQSRLLPQRQKARQLSALANFTKDESLSAPTPLPHRNARP